MITMVQLSSLASLALLSACGAAENDPGPGGVTVGEARELDEAAEMLDARRGDAGNETAADTKQTEKAESE